LQKAAKVPPLRVSALPLLMRSVGVARLLRVRARVPPLTVTPPVRVFGSDPLRLRTPAPALVSPAEPARIVAEPLPMVAVMPEPRVTVGAVPLRVMIAGPVRV